MEIKTIYSIARNKNSFSKKIENNHQLYIKKCSDCHGKNRSGLNIKEGEKQTKFIPSLVGFYEVPGMDKKIQSLQQIKSKHASLDLNTDELLRLQSLFKWWDGELRKKNELKIVADGAWAQ